MPSLTEDIVISGIGGYFPGSSNVEEWKKHLYGNEILLEEKWSKDHEVCNLLGSITTNRFDHSYFGIHRTQTAYMDPLHRIALERTFEAIIDAGINPNSIRGKKIGCYLGMTMDENNSLFLESVVSGFGVTGHSRAMLPNRISYWLNLKGPSVAYDCNWITGLEVIRLACAAIQGGQIEGAIVGAANVSFFPEFQKMYDEMNLISADATTKAFDVDAKGYARSDGVVILYIQKSSTAKRSYGSIVHINTEYNGNTDSRLLNISTPLMAEFLENFYRDSPVKPEEIDYVETYGCGIKEIDKSELDALETVYCQNRSSPLLIGSVKTQSGHAESCCTLFSLVKVLVAMEEEMLPATLQFENPNPEIRGLVDGKFEVVKTNTKWNSDYAAVNGIGINNYFGHIIIKRNPKAKVIKKCDLPPFLPISTRTEETVQQKLAKLKEKPYDPEYHRLVQEVFSKHVPLHMYRGYLLQAQETLESIAHQDGKKLKVWFVYSGMGSQFNGMLSDFMKIPIMAKSITNSHNIMMSRGVDLMDVLTNPDKTIFNNILNCFVGIAAIQIALTDLLKAIGIVPDGIIGHSVGELGCAYGDGCMTAEEMILSSYSRGKASLEATLIRGMMAAVGQGYNQIKDQLPPTIEVACHNASDSCTLSGPTEDMEKFVKELQDKGIFARLVNAANIAYHSQHVQPAGPILHKYLKEVLKEPKLRSRKWISTSVKAENWNTELAKYSSAEYHTNNLLSYVLFEEGCKHIPKDAILIEIAPHGLLQAILKRSLKECANIPLTNRSAKSGVEFLLQSLGKLYLLGVHMDIWEIYPPIDFPVSRNTPTLSDLAGWNYTDIWEIPNAEDQGAIKGIKNIQINLNNEKFEDLVGHEIKGNLVMPLSCFLILLYQNMDAVQDTILFENLQFRKQLVLSKSTKTPLHLIIQIASGEFEFWSDKDFILSGKVSIPEESDVPDMNGKIETNEDSIEIGEDDIYEEMRHRGYNYTRSFRMVKQLRIAEEGSIAKIDYSDQWPILVEGMIQQQIFLSGEKYQDIQLPKTINSILIQTKKLSTAIKTIEVNHDYATKIISTDGIRIKDMTTTPWTVPDTELVLESVEYIQLEKLSYEEFEAALESAIQLTHGNFSMSGIKTILVTNFVSRNNNSFNEILEKVAKTLVYLNINVLKAESPNEIYIQQVYPHLIVTADDSSDEILKKIASSDAFLFTKTTDFALTYPEIIELVRINVNGVDYSILRKINRSEVTMVKINDQRLSVNGLKDGSATWVSKVVEAAKNSRNKRVYFITNSTPVEGYEYFVRTLRQQPQMQNIQFLFNLDNFQGDLTPILQKSLIVSILKNGTLITNVHHSLKYKKNDKSKSDSENQNKTGLLQYLSLNLEDETIDPVIDIESRVGNIDYSRVDNKTGKRIMGLAQLHEDGSQIKFDPIFKWEVPEQWSLQDAVTVPHAYLSAYYMLNMKAKIRSGDTVIIHAGCSPVGLAAISIAFSHNCHIFTTVFNMQQKVYLAKKFVFLNRNNIYILDDVLFRSQFMETTMGEGAKIVLNCLSGEYLRNSMECCGHLSRFIHYGTYDLDNGTSIGMARFMLNLSFYVVNLNNLVNLENEEKQELWRLVADGLESEAIKPLVWEYRSPEEVPELLQKQCRGNSIGKYVLRSDSEQMLGNFTNNKFICSPRSSYIVFGGNSDDWMNVVEWLVHRGAKTIIISSEMRNNLTNLNRRLSLFHSYFGAEVIVSRSIISSEEDIKQLLAQSSALGQIDAVFLLPTESSKFSSQQNKIVESLVSSLNKIAPEASLINFIKIASGICQTRADAGYRTYSIELRDHGDIRDGLQAFNQIVATDSNHTIMQKELSGNRTITSLGLLLPKIEEIMDYQKNSSVQPDVVQVLTEGPTKIRELAPIFIIEGFAGKVNIKKMAQSLLYPTYCTVMPGAPWPIEDLAEIYADKIEKIYPENTYNLISMSTGGALMLEIARKLREKRENAAFHLFFIDSAPATIQEAIVQLGENDNYEINILRAIFKIDDTAILNRLRSIETWEERIEFCTKTFDHRSQLLIQRGLVSLKHMLDISKRCKPHNLSMKGKVHLLRPTNEFGDCDLVQYCNIQPLLKHVDGDHLSIISHPETVDYINFHVDV